MKDSLPVGLKKSLFWTFQARSAVVQCGWRCVTPHWGHGHQAQPQAQQLHHSSPGTGASQGVPPADTPPPPPRASACRASPHTPQPAQECSSRAMYSQLPRQDCSTQHREEAILTAYLRTTKGKELLVLYSYLTSFCSQQEYRSSSGITGAFHHIISQTTNARCLLQKKPFALGIGNWILLRIGQHGLFWTSRDICRIG